MKIHAIEYKNEATGLEIAKTTFEPLTLLVGVSGVGKTLILRSLYKMVQWMSDRKPRGLDAWGDKFSTNAQFRMEFMIDDKLCQWGFKTRPVGWSSSQISQLSLTEEKLFIDGEEIFNRHDEVVEMAGYSNLPSISPDRSVLSIFKTEKRILRINEQLKQVFLFESDPDLNNYITANNFQSLREYVQSNYQWFINDATVNSLAKLAVIAYVRPDVLEEVKASFTHIFPTIEDIKAEVVGDYVMLAIKEHGVWIYQNDISCGMLKTLAHIVNFRILPTESVLLIDELENSLGINCIDSVVEELIAGRRDLQFIVTSHHPYIINNIPSSCWKVVRRKGAVITAVPAQDLDIGVSSQESFFQLMNALNFNGSM